MPVPNSATIKAAILAGLPPTDFPSPPLPLIEAITGALAAAWLVWSAGLVLAGNAVAGTGIGAWAGAGGGGKFAGAPMLMVTVPPFPTPDNIVLCNKIDTEINAEFVSWLSSYTVSTMKYTGTSTATPVSPGTFTAANSPILVKAAGAGTDPVGFSAKVQGELTTAGWNMLTSKMPILLDAIESSLSAAWETWLASGISVDKAGGVAAVVTGTGAGVSAGGIIT